MNDRALRGACERRIADEQLVQHAAERIDVAAPIDRPAYYANGGLHVRQYCDRACFAAALRRLSPDDRAVITLVELEEFSMEDAARRLGCGLSAVKVRAFRARRRLKAILEDLRPGKDEPA